MRLFHFILLNLFLINISIAQIPKEALLPTKPKNCFITITSTLKTGEVQKNTRKFFYKSKDKCEKMNRILSDNFSPRQVTKVSTNMEWKGE